MKSRLRLLIGLAGVLAAYSTAYSQTSYPMVKALRPLAARAGETSEHVVEAEHSLAGTYQVIVNCVGVTGAVVADEAKTPSGDSVAAADNEKAAAEKALAAAVAEAEKKAEADKMTKAEKKAAAAKAAAAAKKPPIEKLKLSFTVAQDVMPGAYDFRIVTPRGASTLGQVVVVRDPVVVESRKNDSLQEAMSVVLPVTICGVIEKEEDVDFYKFHVEAGTALTFHVHASRCMDRINTIGIARPDPIIKVKNASGTVVAVSDNYFSADPLLCYRFPVAGDYYLEIRDLRYAGNAFWQYCVEVNDRPFITNSFPLGVTPETPTRLELVGCNLPAGPTLTVTLPGSLPEGPQRIELPLAGGRSNPVPVVVSHLPQVQQAPDNHEPGKAQEIPVPAGINGRIAAPGQADYYRFEAKAKERFSFEVVARRQQSALDPILAISNEAGSRLTESDDTTFGRLLNADAMIENWIAPADGRYTLELRDVHLRGGPEYVYFLKATRSQPHFLLEIDGDKTHLTRSTAGVFFVRALRKCGFSGEVALAVEGLPPGVTATCGRILEGANDACVILQATADAPLSATNIRVVGTATSAGSGDDGKLSAEATPFQEIHASGGSRLLYPAEMHTVWVGEPLDVVAVKLDPANVEIKPGGSQKIAVKIERAAGFDKNVTLDVMSRHLGGMYGNSLPAGVTLDEKASKTLLTGTQTEGLIVLKAAADAKPVEKQLVPVIANVSITFALKTGYAAEPMFITVVKP